MFFVVVFLGVFLAPEAFRKLPGARGFVFPKYEPVASHGDHIHSHNYLIFLIFDVPNHMFLKTLSIFIIFGGYLEWVRPS